MTLGFWNQQTDVVFKSGIDREMVEALPNGGYVVAWRSSNDQKVYFQIYDGAGQKVGGAHSLIDDTHNKNIVDIQAIGTDGSFAITWNDSLPNQTTSFGFKTLVFDVNGNVTSGSDPIVLAGNDQTIDNKEAPSMARNGASGFVTAYIKNEAGKNTNTVYLAYQGLDGKVIGSPLTIATGTNGAVNVAEIGAGKFAVTYTVGTGPGAVVKTKIITGSSVPTSDTTVGSGQVSDIVALKNADGEATGAFAVTTQFGQTVSTTFYNADGTAQTNADNKAKIFSLTALGLTDSDSVHATALTGGRVAVIYSAQVKSGSNITDNGDVFLTILDPGGNGSNGTTVTFPAPLDVRAASGGAQKTPTIAELPDGRLAVAWHDPNISGGAVISTVIVDPRIAPVSVDGTAGNDIYYGSEYGVDILKGYGGNDRLYGGNGDDVLFGGAGADHLDGGAGSDWADYSGAAAGVVASLTTNLNGVVVAIEGEAIGDTYFSIENLRGSIHNDILIGDGNANSFDGGAGYDRFYGGAGEVGDTFEGGDTSSSNIVTYEYSTAGIGITLDLKGNTSTGEAKGDVFSHITGYVGTIYADRMIGKELSYNEFFGYDGNDVLIGGQAGDYLNGGNGDDTLQGGAGPDTLVGGDGFDFASYEDAESRVIATLGSKLEGASTGDTYDSIEGLIGSNFDDDLYGNADANFLRGGKGNDKLYGQDGNDWLQGGAGADALNGGDGTDIVSYDDSDTGLTISLDARFANTGIAAGDTYDGIEGVSGSNHNDLIYGNAENNILLGQAGNDTLVGGDGADRMEGGAGNDVYYVDALDTVIEAAGQGYDTVIVTTGYTLTAGSEIESVVYAGSGPVSLNGNELANVLSGASGNDNLSGGGGNDALYGGGGNDALSGGSGADVMDGGTGADVMDGGADNDTYMVDNAGDVVSDSGGGIDTAYASVSYALNATVENLIATGAGAIALTGNAFVNTITGNAGANKISGGLGNDMLIGGAGKDVFVFDTKPNKSTNKDKILDFYVKDDSIYLDNKYFTKLGKAGTPTKPKQLNKDFFTIGTKAKDKNDYLVYDNKKGVLYYDADGSGRGKAVEIATLSKNLKMTYKDFFVI